MALRSFEERRKNREEIKALLKSKDNRRWYYGQWFSKIAKVFGVCASVWGFIQAPLGIDPNFWELVAGVAGVTLIAAIATYTPSQNLIKSYLHKTVETERPGCSVEIRVADSYLTNAFKNYPKSTMLIGLNKAFWFQEAEPRSLVADMWDDLKKRGVEKETVQALIDDALKTLREEKGDAVLDEHRRTVQVRKARGDDPNADDFVIRDNYKIGTIVGVDLKCTEPPRSEERPLYSLVFPAIASGFSRTRYQWSKAISFLIEASKKGKMQKDWGKQYEAKFPRPETFRQYLQNHRMVEIPATTYLRKLYFIANSEIVQGKDTTEHIKVAPDKHASVVESFEKIWEYFEQEEVLNEQPPKARLYQPLLIPLIGGGVANEGYTDLEIFSKLIDLYYAHLRKSIHADTQPAIPRMIINIQSKTAIKNDASTQAQERKIDIQTAFWYLDYRNQVNLPINMEGFMSRQVAAPEEVNT